MQLRKTLASGLNVNELTAAEFYACIDYATMGGGTYPLQTLGISTADVNNYAVSGYNSLIDEKAFHINQNGYPELTASVPDITNLLFSLDEMKCIVTMRVSLGKQSITFYYLHGSDSWCILWRKKTSWFLVTANAPVTPSTTILELTNTVLSQLGNQRIAIHLTWIAPNDQPIMATAFISTKDSDFVERQPQSNLLGAGHAWPEHYLLGSLGERLDSVLRVM